MIAASVKYNYESPIIRASITHLMAMRGSASVQNAEELIDAMFSALQVPRGASVVIHSAFARLSRAGYDADAVVDAMVDYVGSGTLLMPTMSWRSVTPDNPIFDELATPGITGVLSEIFRLRHATRRSLHPTHSCAGRGPMTDALLSRHHLVDTPCHAASPWGLLDDVQAHVVLLGIGMERCTLIHHAEELVAPDLYLQPPERRERYICRDRYGTEISMFTRRHLKVRRNFHIFEEMLSAAGGVHYFANEQISARAFRADQMIALAIETLRDDPSIILRVPTDLSA